jgi:hypothetical protein
MVSQGNTSLGRTSRTIQPKADWYWDKNTAKKLLIFYFIFVKFKQEKLMIFLEK